MSKIEQEPIYNINTKSYTLNVVEDPARFTSIELGDSKQPSIFYPQFKTLHWDNECNFSVRLIDDNYEVGRIDQEKDGTVTWSKDNKVVRLYNKQTSDEDGGFEFEVEFAIKPDTNVVRFSIQTKNLDFFYQPELTDQEKKTSFRPENVIGSYAVYHKTQRGNLLGSKQYKTGKAFHIYRPFVIDSLGVRVWCELNINEKEELVTITIPQDFLDNAIYPVIVDPTFGYTSIGATNDFNSGTEGSVFTAPSSGTVTKLTTYGSHVFGDFTIDNALYSETSNHPNVPLAISSAVNVTTTGWVDSNTISQAISNGVNYWLMIWAHGGNQITRSDTGAANQSVNQSSGESYSTWPNPYGTPIFQLNIVYSIYATYTASGSTYTLTAAGGVYDITGTAAGLKYSHKVTALSGTFTVSGTDVTLRAIRKLTVSGGTYLISGSSAGLDKGFTLTAAGSSYLITGTSVALRIARKISAASATFTISGTAAILDKGRTITPVSGVFTITGTAVTFIVAHKIIAGSGVYDILGSTVNLTYSAAIPISEDNGEHSDDEHLENYYRRYANDRDILSVIENSNSEAAGVDETSNDNNFETYLRRYINDNV